MRNGSNRWTAKLAACLFVFQALLFGFSMGANAQPMPRDQFGNVICITAPDGEHGTPDKSADHSKMIDCCALGCAMFGADLAPAPPTVSAALELSAPLSISAVPFEGIDPGPDATPRNTRAPPFSA